MKKDNSLVFIGLAWGITWLLWVPALALSASRGYPLPTIDYLFQHGGAFRFVNGEHVLMVISFSLAVYGPLLAGLVAAMRAGGRAQVAAWFAPVLRWRVAPAWYAWVLLIPLTVALVPVLLGMLFGQVAPRPGAGFPSILLILGMFLYQLLTSGLGEEPGWRGYLLPEWQARRGPEKAIWWCGLVWAVWHFPFTIYYTLQGAPGLTLAAQLALVVPALIGQTMSLIGITYIYAWLVNGSRSVWLAILFHALGNTFNALVGATWVVSPIISLAIGAAPWLVVLALDRAGKKMVPQQA